MRRIVQEFEVSVNPDKIRITIHVVEPQDNPTRCRVHIDYEEKWYDRSPSDGRYISSYDEIEIAAPDYEDGNQYLMEVIRNLATPLA